jgi:uncharacterized protein (DUF1697 family)
MTTYLALLRGINVGGHKKIAMSELRDLCTNAGCANARTVLQSGNVIFESAARNAPSLERALEAAVMKEMGVETSFLVRTAAEWRDAIANNPFPREAESDPSHLLVMFLRDAPEPKAVKALQAAIRGREVVRANGRQAYLVYPDGIGESKLTIHVIEKHLATRGTARNWNTVLKMEAIAAG